MPDCGRTVRELVDGLIARDDAVWRVFLQEAGRILQGVGGRAGLDEDEIEDIAQLFVLKLLDGDCRILRALEVKEKGFWAWVKVVLSHLVIDHVRGVSLRKEVESKYARERGASSRGSYSLVEDRLTLEKVVGELEPLDQMVFWLDYNDLKDSEIAKLTGMSEAAVQQRLSRLRRKLGKVAERWGAEG